MNKALASIATVAVSRFVFRKSWPLSLLAGAIVLAVSSVPALTWQRKNEDLTQ